MRNLLVSLYLMIAMTLGMMLPTCAYESTLPNCCKQQIINTCSIQNQCCCCDTLPGDQTSGSIQTTVSSNIEPYACPNAVLSNLIFQQLDKSLIAHSINNENYKYVHLYILYRSLLM